MEKFITYKNYCKSVEKLFNFLKSNTDHKDLFLKSIKIKNKTDYFLVPVCNLHLKDKNIIQNPQDHVRV